MISEEGYKGNVTVGRWIEFKGNIIPVDKDVILSLFLVSRDMDLVQGSNYMCSKHPQVEDDEILSGKPWLRATRFHAVGDVQGHV